MDASKIILLELTPLKEVTQRDMINRERIIQTFCDLVQIDSPSGEEEEMAQEMIGRLEKLGLETKRDDYGNIVASDGRERPILLSAHLDTV